MEKEKIKLYLSFGFCLIVGILCIGSFIFLGIITREWFGKWTLEPMIAFLFLGINFLIIATTYLFDIKGDYKWSKVVRKIVSIIFITILVGFILSSFLITW
ncbi:MAG: hypothetical protein AAB866_02335 [Patescibacteria group bacterium]